MKTSASGCRPHGVKEREKTPIRTPSRPGTLQLQFLLLLLLYTQARENVVAKFCDYSLISLRCMVL